MHSVISCRHYLVHGHFGCEGTPFFGLRGLRGGFDQTVISKISLNGDRTDNREVHFLIQLHPQALEESIHSEFGGAVGRPVPNAELSRKRGEHNNMTFLRLRFAQIFLHVLQSELGWVSAPHQICVNHLLERHHVLEIFKQRVRRYARAQRHDVNPAAQELSGLFYEPLSLFFYRHIELNAFDVGVAVSLKALLLDFI